MTTTATHTFYADLPAHNMSLGRLLTSKDLFLPVPEDWHVIVTDIKNSTSAVQTGKHESVNMVATGSIVSVLNIAFDEGLSVPFFFGGDGAAFLVPPLILERVMKALAVYKTNTLTNFALNLRTGSVPVADIKSAGHELHISKFSNSDSLSIPVVLGNGLNYAEKRIKSEDYLNAGQDDADEQLNLSGMRCRWDKILPPENMEEVVTMLILARDHDQQGPVFSEVMDHIDAIYGSPQTRQPISVNKLKLKTSNSRLRREISNRLGRMQWFELFRAWMVTAAGLVYFKTSIGINYLKRLVEMSDTLVIDGKINTVISGTSQQRKELQGILDTMEAEGKIIYGLHISGASIMSCYVRDLKYGHIHFVDGAEGGYTKAAMVLKAKLAAEV